MITASTWWPETNQNTWWPNATTTAAPPASASTGQAGAGPGLSLELGDFKVAGSFPFSPLGCVHNIFEHAQSSSKISTRFWGFRVIFAWKYTPVRNSNGVAGRQSRSCNFVSSYKKTRSCASVHVYDNAISADVNSIKFLHFRTCACRFLRKRRN